MRQVDEKTRSRLFARLNTSDTADLRSFLDPPKKPGLTVKGSGDVAFRLYKRNHTKCILPATGQLHDMVIVILKQHTLVKTNPLYHTALTFTHIYVTLL